MHCEQACHGRTSNHLPDIEVTDHVLSDEAGYSKRWTVSFTTEAKSSDDYKIYRAPKDAADMAYESVIPKLKSRYEKQCSCVSEGLVPGRKRSFEQISVVYDQVAGRKKLKQKRKSESWRLAFERSAGK